MLYYTMPQYCTILHLRRRRPRGGLLAGAVLKICNYLFIISIITISMITIRVITITIIIIIINVFVIIIIRTGTYDYHYRHYLSYY